MKSSKLLAMARKEIYAERHEFICNAIECVAERSSHAADKALKKEIRKRMDGCFTLGIWLLEKGHASYRQTENYKDMKEYRLRWLDSLIKEYKAKGD